MLFFHILLTGPSLSKYFCYVSQCDGRLDSNNTQRNALDISGILLLQSFLGAASEQVGKPDSCIVKVMWEFEETRQFLPNSVLLSSTCNLYPICIFIKCAVTSSSCRARLSTEGRSSGTTSFSWLYCTLLKDGRQRADQRLFVTASFREPHPDSFPRCQSKSAVAYHQTNSRQLKGVEPKHVCSQAWNALQ